MNVVLTPLWGAVVDSFGHRAHWLLLASGMLLCSQPNFILIFGQMGLVIPLLLIGTVFRSDVFLLLCILTNPEVLLLIFFVF